MKSPFNFIVQPHNGRRYDNIKKISGIDFITSSSQEDHTKSNRFAKVISTPLGYEGDVSEGDIIIVHHNVFKYYYDMKGRQQSGRSFFKDDLFLVDDTQFYLYGNENKWKSNNDFCFIKPAERQEYYIFAPGKEQPLVGYIVYGNKELESFGVKEGDLVSYRPDSEYPFVIDNNKLYRMKTRDIVIKL